MSEEPKDPPPTGWITMTEMSDGPSSGAIYGVGLLCLALVVVLAVLVLG